MNAKRAFYGMIVGTALFAALGVAGIVLGNSILQKQGNTLVDLRLLGRALDEEQTAATRARQDISKYAELNHTATVIVPQEKDQALAVRELVDLAGKSGIKIGSITFPASNLGVKGGTATKPTSLSQVTPVTGISGVYQMPITLQSDTSAPTDFTKLVNFLGALENNRRTAQVGQVTITPSDTSGKRLSFVLVVNVYIKP